MLFRSVMIGSYEYRDTQEYGCHKWGEWKVYEPADCLNAGEEYRECERCRDDAGNRPEEERVIPVNPNAHKFSNWYTIKRATALKNGTASRECDVCHCEDNKSIPKLKAKITLKKKTITVKRKKSYTLKIKSKTYGDKVKKWKSKNKKIATVSSKGKVTGKKRGTTTVTLYMESGAKVSCKVKVK